MGIDEVRANYNGAGIDIIELMYGADYLSFGGAESTEILANKAGIDERHRVLDIGCGLGGPAFHLAETRGCQVVGVDLVELNIEQASARAGELGLGDLLTFEAADARDLPFGDGSFDVVWGQDAWCHVPDKDRLIGECARLLVPGGTIAFSDWLQTGDMSAAMAAEVFDASAIDQPEDIDGYRALLTDHGFVDVMTEDISAAFLRSYREVMDRLAGLETELSER
ncbi:MAG: methyltransferase domain-containing protein, partial [Actinomycetia bacterium]|nr:methyltransferase domain-containing protein [Actinomycetes bacterium]